MRSYSFGPSLTGNNLLSLSPSLNVGVLTHPTGMDFNNEAIREFQIAVNLSLNDTDARRDIENASRKRQQKREVTVYE